MISAQFYRDARLRHGLTSAGKSLMSLMSTLMFRKVFVELTKHRSIVYLKALLSQIQMTPWRMAQRILLTLEKMPEIRAKPCVVMLLIQVVSTVILSKLVLHHRSKISDVHRAQHTAPQEKACRSERNPVYRSNGRT